MDCSSKFIRRGYLSKHLQLCHGYSKKYAAEKAFNAERGDVTRDRYVLVVEDISNDEMVWEVLGDIINNSGVDLEQENTGNTKNDDVSTEQQDRDDNSNSDNNNNSNVENEHYITIDEANCEPSIVRPTLVKRMEVYTLTIYHKVEQVGDLIINEKISMDCDYYEY